MQQEVRDRLAGAAFTILADCRGMNVQSMSDLRKRLGEHNSRLMVVRNSFLDRAARDAGWGDTSALLKGPTAMITGDGDVTQVAKLLREIVKSTKMPLVKGGEFSGQILSDADVEALATIPPREILLGHLVGTIAAPMSSLVGVMQQKLASIVYALKAVAEKKSGNA
jgi:large subunit ribosomal protein L10